MFSDHFNPAPTMETGYPSMDNGMYRACVESIFTHTCAATVVPTKSDSDVVFCLLLLRKH